MLHLTEIYRHVFFSLHTLYLCVFVSWFLKQMRHLKVFLHVKLSCSNYWHFVHCINVLNWNFVVFIWFAFMLNSCKTICNSFSSLMFNIIDEKGFFKCIAETHLESFANFTPGLYFSMSNFRTCMSVANQVFTPSAKILCHVLFLAYVCFVPSWKHSFTAFSFMTISIGMTFRWFDVFVLFLCLMTYFCFFLCLWLNRRWKWNLIENVDYWIVLCVWLIGDTVEIVIAICESMNWSMFPKFLVGIVGSMGVLSYLSWVRGLHKSMISGFVVMKIFFVTCALYFTFLWTLDNVVFLF